jgi:hypothetical protein
MVLAIAFGACGSPQQSSTAPMASGRGHELVVRTEPRDAADPRETAPEIHDAASDANVGSASQGSVAAAQPPGCTPPSLAQNVRGHLIGKPLNRGALVKSICLPTPTTKVMVTVTCLSSIPVTMRQDLQDLLLQGTSVSNVGQAAVQIINGQQERIVAWDDDSICKVEVEADWSQIPLDYARALVSAIP